MKRPEKWVASLRVSLGILLVLLFCSGVAFAGGVQGLEAEQESVTFFLAFYNGLTEEFPTELTAAFKAEHPEIDLAVVLVQWGALHEKLITSIAGGQPPEASVIGTRWLLELMEMGVVEEVAEYVSSATTDNIFESVMEAKIGGKLMALPVAAGPRILSYNPNLTSAVPKTMEELRECVIEVNNPPNAYGITMPGAKGEELCDFVYYFYAAGGRFFEQKADGSYGKCTVNSPEGVKALSFMVQLATQDKVVQEGFTGMTGREASQLFYAGKAGYYMTGAWVETVAKRSGSNFQPMYAQIPPFAGGESAPLVVTDSVAIFKNTNSKAAGKFLDFFYQDAWRTKFDTLIAYPPVTRTVAKLPQFDTSLYRTLAEANLHAVGWPLIDGWAEFSEIIWDANIEAFLGRKTPKQALDDAATKIDQIRGI